MITPMFDGSGTLIVSPSCICMECCRNQKVNEVAALCHEINRAYCASLGDTSQPAWEDAPAWMRESAVRGVLFHFENETTPEMSHESWMAQKVADGWVYGEVKDAEKKTHPCMVPYAQLPQAQRSKDFIFKAICDYHK